MLRRLSFEDNLPCLSIHHVCRLPDLLAVARNTRPGLALVRSRSIPHVLQTSDSNATGLYCICCQLSICMLHPNLCTDVLWRTHGKFLTSRQLDHRLHVHHLRPSSLFVLHDGFRVFARTGSRVQAWPHRANYSPFWHNCACDLLYPFLRSFVLVRCPNYWQSVKYAARGRAIFNICGFRRLSWSSKGQIPTRKRCKVRLAKKRQWRRVNRQWWTFRWRRCQTTWREVRLPWGFSCLTSVVNVSFEHSWRFRFIETSRGWRRVAQFRGEFSFPLKAIPCALKKTCQK